MSCVCPEFLLGQYCSSDDETVIEKGVQNEVFPLIICTPG